MAEGHIEFTLSMCVCLFVCLLVVSALQTSVRPISLSCMVGFKNCLVEMIITRRQCGMCKNHVGRSKVKVIVCTLTLYISFSDTCSCPALNFVFHSGI